MGRRTSLSELVDRARAGDLAAFEQIVVSTSPKVWALVYGLLGNEHDARDVMQETYLRAFRAIEGFRADAAVTTWLHRIAVNCCATHLSRRQRLAVLALDPDDEDGPVEPAVDHNPETALAALDERARLVAALKTLPYGLRAVVVLSDVYDLPHEVIGSELGISRAAVKVRLHRGRRRLRDLLFVAPAGASDDREGSEPTDPVIAPIGRTETRTTESRASRRREAGGGRAVAL